MTFLPNELPVPHPLGPERLLHPLPPQGLSEPQPEPDSVHTPSAGSCAEVSGFSPHRCHTRGGGGGRVHPTLTSPNKPHGTWYSKGLKVRGRRQLHPFFACETFQVM